MARTRPAVLAMRDEIRLPIARLCPDQASTADVMQIVDLTIERLIQLWEVVEPWDTELTVTPKGMEALKLAQEGEAEQ